MADSETRLYGMADPSNNQRPPGNGMRGEGAAEADGAMPPRAVDLPGEGTVLVEETSGVAYAEAARVDPPASSTLPLPSSRPDRGSSALPWVLVASVLGFAAGRLQPRAFRVEKRNASPAALARLPGEAGGFSQVRDSGPEEMRDPEPDWSEIDEAIDESFPASDPPAWSAPRRDYPAAGQRASSSIAHGASSEGASASGGRAALLGYGLAGAALAALGLSLARGSAMDRNDIGYPSLDQPKPVAPDVWIVDSGPVNAMGLKLPIRMTIVRLKNGDVLLHSPTRHTPALAEAIKGIGPVRHIVAPATGHWMFVEEWQQAFPAATTWAVPVLRERAQVRRSAMRIDAVLGDGAPSEWGAGIRQGLVRGAGGFEEAWLFHEESRVLILTDLIHNLDPQKLSPITAMVMRAARSTNATSSLHVRAALTSHRDDARRAVNSMIAADPQTIVFTHGDYFRGRGAERLREAFAWLSPDGETAPTREAGLVHAV